MITQTHDTVATELAEAGGMRFAYRRLGSGRGVPLLFLQRFRGTMDEWDPSVVDAFALDRPVLLFDNRGIGRSTGETPSTVLEMARDAIALLETLEVPRVDLLGFSLGGMVAQQILFERPALVRRAILVGTGGPGASGMFPAEVTREATKYPGDADVMLDLFFSPSEAGQAAGRRHVQRIFSRTDREPASSRQTMEAHHTAIRSWGDLDGEAFARLLDVRQPVPIVNGAHDIMIPPYNAYALSQQLPDAQLILYPDAGHGSLFQYPEWFVHDASRFLGRD